MNSNLLAEGLDGSLAEIVAKLQSLIDSFWIYIVIALAAVVVIWGAYIGIKIAIAHRNEEKINARDMIKNLVIGIVIIFVVAMGAPLLINGLSAWVGAEIGFLFGFNLSLLPILSRRGIARRTHISEECYYRDIAE